jgi:oxazoline/thiazoline synthase
MLNQPKLNSCVRVKIVPPAEVFLLGERESIVLNGQLYALLMPLLDGSNSTDDIIELLADRTSAAEIYYALMLLMQKGYIHEGANSDRSESIISVCEALKIDIQQAERSLTTKMVTIKNSTDLDSSNLLDLLASLHIKVVDADKSIALTIVITDNYLAESLESIDRESIADNVPWMLIAPGRMNPWIGPIFVPDKTACWHCLRQRLIINSPIESYIQRHCPDRSPLSTPLNIAPTTVNIAWNIATTEIFKWVTQGAANIQSTLISYNPRSTEIERHPVTKRPQCHMCGERPIPTRQPQPLQLEHQAKTLTIDGGYRTRTPEQTLQLIAPQIDSITGIVRSISKIPVADTNLNHTYVAKHHFAPNFDDLENLHLNIVGRSAGKGKTDRQAQASAVCEAIERYSGSYDEDEIRHQHSYRSLGELAIHPNHCMLFSPNQYQQRHSWNQECQGWFQKVPAPFDEESIGEWTPVWSLTDRMFKYLPTAYCYYGYPQTTPMCWADSNGCATGNTLEEAILQGFMEVVERDCVAIWWYNRLQRPQVDLSSFDDPYFLALQAEYLSKQRDLWVLDITNDLGIPTFVALTRRLDRQPEDIVLGFGTHFDPTLAIGRALTEVNQILPNVLTTNAAGNTKYPQSYNPIAIDWWQTSTLANQPYLAPHPQLPPKQKADYLDLWHDDLLEDLLACQHIVESHGMELLVLNQTRPDIVGLKVAKTIVPGLRHLWKRLAPGRLYDVPVNLGWLTQPHQEAELNPFPMWM